MVGRLLSFLGRPMFRCYVGFREGTATCAKCLPMLRTGCDTPNMWSEGLLAGILVDPGNFRFISFHAGTFYVLYSHLHSQDIFHINVEDTWKIRIHLRMYATCMKQSDHMLTWWGYVRHVSCAGFRQIHQAYTKLCWILAVWCGISSIDMKHIEIDQ